MNRNIKNSSIGLNSKLKNFILYVYSLGGVGILLCFGIAKVVGEVLISIVNSGVGLYGMIIPLLIIGFVQMYIDIKLADMNYVLNTKVNSLLILLIISIFLNGVLLSPIIFIFKYNPMLVLTAFLITFFTFIFFALYVFISGKDLAFRKNQANGEYFQRIMMFLFISIIILMLLKFIIGIFNPAIADTIDNIYLIFSLILALIFVVYYNALIRDMYETYSHDGVSLSRLGVSGASLIINSFLYLFRIVLRILLKINNKK